MSDGLSKIDNSTKRTYIAIDLKSFYASVECVARDLDPLKACLVVADAERTEKTICLAVSPALKAYGIPGRARLFEVVQKVKEANLYRKSLLNGKDFSGASFDADELAKNKNLAIDYIVARPRMAEYMSCSTAIYKIYLNFVSSQDIHVYSCDEVFIDVTTYLSAYGMSARELTKTIIRQIEKETGITATAGIGSNLFLAKIAMDIEAKHIDADSDGVRIAELNERTYREKLWSYTPISDFWRVGPGTARRLSHMGIYTMGDLARHSEYDEDGLYKEFGVNAELLIDHAWGWEPCTIDLIKAYKPETNSLSLGQVLQRGYDHKETEVIVREMTEQLTLELVEKELVTDQMVLNIGYDALSFDPKAQNGKYKGETSVDRYGRVTPKHATGTVNLDFKTSSTMIITDAVVSLYRSIINPELLTRRLSVVACKVTPESQVCWQDSEYVQLDLFTDYEQVERERRELEEKLAKEKALQQATIQIKNKYGKNAILKGTNFRKGSTAMERNRQIGGHKA
ncbi:MAG: DNA methylase [Lachnospiraceae bacterium]|nr:DNA methylase [Lachnospiraceae bacterium]